MDFPGRTSQLAIATHPHTQNTLTHISKSQTIPINSQFLGNWMKTSSLSPIQSGVESDLAISNTMFRSVLNGLTCVASRTHRHHQRIPITWPFNVTARVAGCRYVVFKISIFQCITCVCVRSCIKHINQTEQYKTILCKWKKGTTAVMADGRCEMSGAWKRHIHIDEKLIHFAILHEIYIKIPPEKPQFILCASA